MPATISEIPRPVYPAARRVFVSYSRHDRDLFDELIRHLRILSRRGVVGIFHDGCVDAGESWEQVIFDALDAADVFLPLVTASFVQSEYCWGTELKAALARRDRGQLLVIPIYGRPCNIDGSPLADIAGLPNPRRPVVKWRNRDEAWTVVAQAIAERISGAPPAAPPTPQFESDSDRQLSTALVTLYSERERRVCQMVATRTLDSEILRVRRQLRTGRVPRGGELLGGGRFQLLELEGAGTYGGVWRAYDRVAQELVAVKILHGDWRRDGSKVERFFRGAAQMARLRHRGVVRIVEPRMEEKSGPRLFFVMEHVTGGDLQKRVLRGGILATAAVLIVFDVAIALAISHRSGCVHRDVKPANILLTENLEPKITDFDLVMAPGSTGGTRTGGLGTFYYAAPEQLVLAKDVGSAADVFSLGMTLVFALFGAELPPEAFGQEAIPNFIASLPISRELAWILVRATEWDHAARYPDMELFAADLLTTPEASENRSRMKATFIADLGRDPEVPAGPTTKPASNATGQRRAAASEDARRLLSRAAEVADEHRLNYLGIEAVLLSTVDIDLSWPPLRLIRYAVLSRADLIARSLQLFWRPAEISGCEWVSPRLGMVLADLADGFTVRDFFASFVHRSAEVVWNLYQIELASIASDAAARQFSIHTLPPHMLRRRNSEPSSGDRDGDNTDEDFLGPPRWNRGSIPRKPARWLEVLGGPEDGLTIAMRPGVRLGRAGVKSFDSPGGLYRHTPVVDRVLSREAAEIIGEGLLKVIKPLAHVSGDSGESERAPAGRQVEVYDGDVIRLSRRTAIACKYRI